MYVIIKNNSKIYRVKRLIWEMFLIGRNKKGGRLSAICITLHERYTHPALGTLAEYCTGGHASWWLTLSLQVLRSDIERVSS